MQVRCGNHGTERVFHDGSAEVRLCFQGDAEQEAQIRLEREVEYGFERYLEDRGFEAARWDEQREAALIY